MATSMFMISRFCTYLTVLSRCKPSDKPDFYSRVVSRTKTSYLQPVSGRPKSRCNLSACRGLIALECRDFEQATSQIFNSAILFQ
jgi:hypothetical protein